MRASAFVMSTPAETTVEKTVSHEKASQISATVMEEGGVEEEEIGEEGKEGEMSKPVSAPTKENVQGSCK